MDMYEAEELAIAALSLSKYSNSDDIEVAIFETFGISLDTFTEIASALLPLTVPAQGAITSQMYQGFVKDNVFIVKKALS